jgi:hypothetical protein
VDQELVLVISIQVSDSPAFVSERIIANALSERLLKLRRKNERSRKLIHSS